MPLQSERSVRLSLESCPSFDTVDVVLQRSSASIG